MLEVEEDLVGGQFALLVVALTSLTNEIVQVALLQKHPRAACITTRLVILVNDAAACAHFARKDVRQLSVVERANLSMVP